MMQTAADVLKHALANEVKAGAFYQKAAEVTENDESRMLLLELAGMEDDHSRSLLKRAANAPCAQEFDPYAYLKDLEDNAAASIPESAQAVIKSGDMRAILNFAISLEQEARDTYIELGDKAVDEEMKKYCVELAREEDGHVRQLERLKLSLDMDAESRPAL